MIVRSLLTALGFETDTKKLANYAKMLTGVYASFKLLIEPITKFGIAAFKTAGDIEQIEIAFETMLGSADKADKLLKEITDFAAATPFELQGLVDSSKQLLAFGFAAENIIPTMTVLGDISAGIGKDKLPTIVRSLGKIRTKGKASMEELNMMLEAGVPILDALAVRLGVTQEQLFKMISKGKVGFNDVNAALTDLATGTGKFAGLMKKQSKSFLGIVSNIGDFIYNLTGAIGKDLLPIGKELGKAFLNFLEVNRDIIKSNFVKFFKGLIYVIVFVLRFIQRFIGSMGGLEKIGGVIQGVFDGIFKVFLKIVKSGMKVFLFLFNILNGIGNLFGGWENILKTLIPIILGIIIAIKIWTIVQAILNAVMSINPITLIIIAIIALIALIVLLIKNWDKVVKFLKNIWGKFAKWWSTLFTGIGDFFKKTWDGILNFFKSIWEKIVLFVVAVIKIFVDIFNRFNNFWENVWNGIKSFFEDIWNGFTATVTTVWNEVEKIITGVWESITKTIQKLWEDAVKFVMDLWQGVMDFIDGIKNFAEGVGNFIMGIFGGGKKTPTGTTPPPGAAPIGTPGGGSTMTIENISIGVPAGTPAEQKAYIETNIEKAIKTTFDSYMREGLVNNFYR